MKDRHKPSGQRIPASEKLEARRRVLESCASAGLLLVAVGLAIPFFYLTQSGPISWCRWIYSAGALIYLLARAFVGTDPDESMRVRRLRRIELWAGVAFAVGAGFWFYNFNRFGNLFVMGGALAIIRDTVMFTLVGAALQLIASWMIYFRKKKEQGGLSSEK